MKDLVWRLIGWLQMYWSLLVSGWLAVTTFFYYLRVYILVILGGHCVFWSMWKYNLKVCAIIILSIMSYLQSLPSFALYVCFSLFNFQCSFTQQVLCPGDIFSNVGWQPGESFIIKEMSAFYWTYPFCQ